MLPAVPPCAEKCRFVRGILLGEADATILSHAYALTGVSIHYAVARTMLWRNSGETSLCVRADPDHLIHG